MSRHSFTILPLKVQEQKYSCHSCGLCCRDFTVELREDDIRKLERQRWYERLGQTPYVEFRGRTWLRQREDGSCIFLQEDGLCRIHAEHGLTEKPLACQLFPFTYMPAAQGAVQLGMSFACPSAINSRGADLSTHLPEARRLARLAPELKAGAGRSAIVLKDRIELSDRDVDSVIRAIDGWMTRAEHSIETRLDGMALLAFVLNEEPLDSIVSAGRLGDVIAKLIEALPDELGATPNSPPTPRQKRQLRQLVFAHVEDPKIPAMRGRFAVQRRAWRQLINNRRFSRGRGALPVVIGSGWPRELRFESVDGVGPASDPGDKRWIDSLLTRYVRARVLGARAFGAGYYGFSILTGLNSLMLTVAVTGWLARLHAAANGRSAIAPPDIEAALIRADRAAGRAPWLGSRAEKLRLRYLTQHQGVRRLRYAYRLTDI